MQSGINWSRLPTMFLLVLNCDYVDIDGDNLDVRRQGRFDRHDVPHDALLQLRCAPHVWPQPEGVLSVRLQASPWGAPQLPLAASARHDW